MTHMHVAITYNLGVIFSGQKFFDFMETTTQKFPTEVCLTIQNIAPSYKM